MNATRWLLKSAAALLAFAAPFAQAGGPLAVCNGAPLRYNPASVALNYDGGGALGSRTKAQADAIVTNSIALWTNVGTANIMLTRGADLPVDVTAGNYGPFLSNFSDGLNPVIYDTDGTIIDTILGVGQRNSVLGFAGSAWFTAPTCRYAEGRAVINGFIGVSDTTMTVVLAHEIGHLIGLDHTQLDSSQGLAGASYPLMYPIAFRGSVSLHDDDVAAVSGIYPDTTLNSVYGQITGNFTLANGVTPVPGANLWARETSTNRLYSIVSGYLDDGTSSFRLLLPAGTYTLHAEAIASDFDGGSSVGPYSDTYPSGLSFQSPLYVGGVPMTPLTLGNGTPIQFAITAGCAATAVFRFDGTGSIGGNCGVAGPPQTLTVSRTGPGTGTVTSSPAGINCGATCSASFGQGSLVTLTASPAGGSAFGSWSGACSGSATTCNVTMSAAQSVTANFVVYTQPSLTITRTGSGTGVVTSSPAGFNCGSTCFSDLLAGTVITLIATPNAGSTFTGWSGACSGTGNCTLTINSAVTATANFNSGTPPPPPQFALTVTRSGSGTGTVTSSPAGINCGATCNANFNQGTGVTLTATPVAGSTFSGWSGACSGVGTCTVTMNAAASVQAVFTNQVALTVTRSGTGTGTVTSNPAGINCGATCSTTFGQGVVVALTATPTSGSTFTGWSGACSGTGSCSVTLNAASSVGAAFTITPPSSSPALTITRTGTGTGRVTSLPEGFDCGSACSSPLLGGTVLTLIATPNAGSTFTGWSGACSGTGNCTLTITSAVTATANFNSGTAPPPPPPQFLLTLALGGTGTGTVTSSPAGINCGATCSANFNQATSVTLTPTAGSGSTFAGWTGSCSGTGSCTVVMSAVTSVGALFNITPATQFPLTVTRSGTGAGTVTSTPAGINCGATCSANFAQGTIVSLTATPSAGSTFTGWSGGCSGAGSCSVTVNAASSVGAVFTTTPPPPPPPPSGTPSLTITKAGTGTGRVTSSPEGFDCGGACFSDLLGGTVLTLIATPNAGSTFTGWSGACSGTGNCTLTITSAVTATANFNSGTAPPPPPPTQFALSVTRSGTGTGTVTSSPAGINCGATCSANFVQGTSVSLTPTPSSGSTFAGWSGACSGTGSCTVAMNAVASVDAVFNISAAPQFPLTVTRSGTGTGTVTSNPAGISCGATCSANFTQGTSVSLTATPSAGSTFTGWSGACSGAGSCSVTVNAASSVGAVFTTTPPPPPPPSSSPSLTITRAGTGTGRVISLPEGFDCGSACFSPVLGGTVLTLIATPNAGSTFTGWSGACSGTGNCALTVSSALVATANFNSGTAPPAPTFVLSVAPSGTGTGAVTSSPAGINCGGTCSTTFAQGTTVSLTATPSAGSAFTGWSGACAGTGSCTVTMNAAASVGAVFTATGPPPPPTGTPSLMIFKAGAGRGLVTSSPEGFYCGSACFSDVLAGTVITLIPTPNPGSTFTGWSGACTGTGTCRLTINSALTVTATFQ